MEKRDFDEMMRNRETLRPDWARLRKCETERKRGKSRPEQFKKYEGEHIKLLEKFPNIKQKSLTEVIASRRSLRQYKQQKLTFEELSYLLYETSKVTRYQENAVFRTIPTGGATNAMETYLFINHVEDIEPGVYHYIQHEHKITPLKLSGYKTKINRALNSQLRDAALVVFFTCVPERSEFKYAFTAHKMIAIEAGHAGQNLHLAAEVIDCGAVMLAAYNQEHSDELLGLDTDKEFTVYIGTLGKK